MRKLAACLLITIIITFCLRGQEKQETFEQRYDLDKKVDEILDKIFYYPKFEGSIYLYIIKEVKTNDVRLRLRFKYRGDRWLEVKRYIFMVDDKRYALTPNKPIERRKINDTTAEEKVEVPVTEDILKILRKLLDAKVPKIRHDGEENACDYTLKGKIIKSLKLTIAAYDELKGSAETQKAEKQ
ncbi:MAG: hypothetical protein GTO45_21715 [Candidatus Aminicenantes bacterium]|nr:hypothetical protein [Candidatus Aminicenantes bacterium]NIM81374.1 hypothetical protein [Candidatus Aminicenantes bacterium]NIN20785.1 hypothetical protein [Candidatus Aminicenantes bacterium]NIN44563.1 hypothetical protein [Candidatus Aminicenantes bacterium]NIN87383.1 hypothetical protein [Candidatus Aminicenantes bacterium]